MAKEKQSRVAQTVSEFGKQSTIPGFSQWHQKDQKSRPSRLFWVIFSIVAFGFCCYHIYHVVQNFIDSPISSSLSRDGPQTLFPDVTICNRRNLGDSALMLYRDELYEKLEKNWGFFDHGYWLKFSYRYPRAIYSYVNRYLYGYMFDVLNSVFWLSEDTKKYGYQLDFLLLTCLYNGKRCSREDFQLLETNRHWNCYIFSPRNKTVFSTEENSGLQLIAFTDSFLNRTESSEIKFYNRMHQNSDEPILYKDFIDKEEKDETFLRDKAIRSEYGAGLEIHIHNHEEYPMSAYNTFVVDNGKEIRLQFEQTDYELLSHQGNPCDDGPQRTIQYVVSFGGNGTDQKKSSFIYGPREIENDYKAAITKSECGCYSHSYPITDDITKVCMFVPKEQRWNSSVTLLKRLVCLSDVSQLEAEVPYKKSDDIRRLVACKLRKYDVSRSVNAIFTVEDMPAFVKYHLASWHPDYMRYNVENTDTRKRLELIFNSLLDLKCLGETNESLSLKDNWCTTKEKLLKNFVKVVVKPRDLVGSVFREFDAYQWPEVLSELGGTLGLWLGMSILIIAELLEFFIQCFCCCQTKKNLKAKNVDDLGDNDDDCEMKLKENIA